MATPCSNFKNTMNSQRNMNNEDNVNKEIVLNVEHRVTFKSNDDILRILKTHPDFIHVQPDPLQPLLASLLSGLIVAGGVSLLYVTGGAALGPMVLVLKTAGSAAVAGGVAGVKQSVSSGFQGSFTWQAWGQEVVTAAAISAFMVAPTYFTGYAVASSGFRYFLPVGKISMAEVDLVKRLTKAATTVVHSMTQAGGLVLKSQVTGKPVDPISLVLTMVQGAFTGFNIGGQISDSVLEDFMMNRGLNYLRSSDSGSDSVYDGIEYSDPASTSEECSEEGYTHLVRHEETLHPSGTYSHTFNGAISGKHWAHPIQRRLLDGRIADTNTTKFIILTGGHGAKDGTSAFTDSSFVEKMFFLEDKSVVKQIQKGLLNGVGPIQAQFKTLNVTDFLGSETDLANAIRKEMSTDGENHIISAWCYSNSSQGDVKNLIIKHGL